MKDTIYFDTSALAKWYLNENRSDDVEKFIRENGPVDISELTAVEMRCLLARRRRENDIDPATEGKAFAAFQEDIRQNFLICHPLPKGLGQGAINLMSVLPEVPLRSLDALHLTIAKEIQTSILATADRIMADAAQQMGFFVNRFF